MGDLKSDDRKEIFKRLEISGKIGNGSVHQDKKRKATRHYKYIKIEILIF